MSYPEKGLRLDINNGPYDDSNSAHLLPLHFFNSNWNNGSSPDHYKIRLDGRCTSLSLPFMVWWVPYLNKLLKPEFNNDPEMTCIEATVWTPLHLFETNRYNGPSLSHGVYICSSLLLIVSWQVTSIMT